MAWYNWSKTASSNATADSTINWAEGQSPSSINDSARAMMARTAEFRDDITGAIATGGTSTAYTVASNQVFDTLAHLSGQIIAFTPNATNTNAVGVDVTLNVDGLGAKPIRMQPSIPLPTGTLILGTPYVVVYNNSDGAFYLHNMTNPYVIPLAAGMDFWGTTTPNSSFAFPTGQAISRTTYASLFSLIGTTYGTGDGSTTFNLPDKTGRVSAMKEASATRLTSAGGGVDGGTIGAAGGNQSHALTAAEIPSISSTATQTITMALGGLAFPGLPTASATIGNFPGASTGSAATPQPYNASANGVQWQSVSSLSGSNTINVTSTGTSGNAHALVQPTIVCNYIIRVI